MITSVLRALVNKLKMEISEKFKVKVLNVSFQDNVSFLDFLSNALRALVSISL